jgi:SAM-dependent methyltransferase
MTATDELRRLHDPHATALWDYAHGRYRPPFHYVRSDGHAAEYDIARRFDPPERFSPQDSFVTAAAYGRTLDAGCGNGKHVAALRDRGVVTVGVDLSALAVATAHHLGRSDVMVMDVFRLGFRTQAFDCVTLYSNGLSMGGSVEGVRGLLTELARVTRPGGHLIMTNTNVAGSPHEHDQAYQRANLAAGRPRGQVRMRCRYDGLDGPWFDWIFLAPQDLPAVLDPTPWRVGQVAAFAAGGYAAVINRQ